MAKYEVRAFGKLMGLFSGRGWELPYYYETDESMTAKKLGERLDIPLDQVEVAFINRTVKPLSTSLKDGDRVSFIPHGVPSIHRFNLGFYEAKE